LAQLDRWQLNGRLAVRTASDGSTANIQWVQDGDDAYAIEFSGPFGQGAAAVRAAAGVVTMELPDQPMVAAADAETLLASQLGWTIPVSGLRYWILGVPAPDAPAETVLDNDGLLVELSQSGWRAEYQRYKPVDGVMLPGKVTLTHAEVRLRFVIDRWRVTAPEPAAG
jgi:outer membrane lipoprotein LolB